MKNYLLFFAMVTLTMTSSCHCSNQNFDEFEGEYHDRTDDPKAKDKTKITNVKNEPYTDIHEIKKEDIVTQPIFKECVGFPISDNKIQEVIINRRAYTVSYNKETLCPNWVAWHLTSEHVDGEWARSNDYREDYDVPAPRATNEDYKGSSWSRGHMCPASDNKWDADAMSESFLLSNMCPQDRSLNSGLWNRIETDCRRWAQKYGEVYIVCGPLFYNKKHETIGENKVAVPEAFFKIILCLQGKSKAIGFVVKNNAGTKKKDQYVNTVDEVERITGYDFFPSLPDSIEEKVEAYSNLEDWR